MNDIRIRITAGELIDRISILRIKEEKLADGPRRQTVHAELAALLAERRRAVADSAALLALEAELSAVNRRLWEIEDAVRQCEAADDFGPCFIELARGVYHNNDRRSALKHQISRLMDEGAMEEKVYGVKM